METSATSLEETEARSIHGHSSTTALQFPVLRFLQSPLQSLAQNPRIPTMTRPDYPSSDETLESDTGPGVSNNNDEVSIGIYGDDEDGVEEYLSGNRENTEASPYQRYDIQQAVKLVEQILPFSLLLLVVFIRQNLQAFVVAVYITAVLIKSDDILRKQTALKGERRFSVLLSYSALFTLHVFAVYLWNRKEGLLYPLFMIPPRTIPPFWHAIFVVLVNDTMVRQASMVLKLAILMHYKNGHGHTFRRQGQMLTVVEHTALLYRTLIPAPIWYRFFLNIKEYGSLFSSLTTGLYMTMKLTYIVEKVHHLVTAAKALSRKEDHYGSYATSQQVNEAGDHCAICQAAMRGPVLLSCKHLFCEECVSEWFERERTCPLCRAVVRPAEMRSYGDGSSSLFVYLF